MAILEPTTTSRREAGFLAYQRKLESLGDRAAISSAYLDALTSASSIPTVAFGLRGYLGTPRPKDLSPITPPGFAIGSSEAMARADTAPASYARAPALLMRDRVVHEIVHLPQQHALKAGGPTGSREPVERGLKDRPVRE